VAGAAKDAVVRTAIDLLAQRGYQGMSFAEVIEASGAPRGSIYHHFPDGKEQLVAAAVARAGHRAMRALDEIDGQPAPKVVDAYTDMWRVVLGNSDLTAGCSVLAVAVSSANPDLVSQSGAVFQAWRERMTEVLAAGGMRRADAVGFSTLRQHGRGPLLLRRNRAEVGRTGDGQLLGLPVPRALHVEYFPVNVMRRQPRSSWYLCCSGSGAGDRDRTGMASLEGWGSAIELHPRAPSRGVPRLPGRAPAPRQRCDVPVTTTLWRRSLLDGRCVIAEQLATLESAPPRRRRHRDPHQ
jgi:TetR/AcrR family transcriptional repressor of lmrAB and yxaGH operons